MVIFHSYVSHNQMVSSDAGLSFFVVFGCLWRGRSDGPKSKVRVGHSQVTWLIVIRPIIRTVYKSHHLYRLMTILQYGYTIEPLIVAHVFVKFTHKWEEKILWKSQKCAQIAVGFMFVAESLVEPRCYLQTSNIIQAKTPKSSKLFWGLTDSLMIGCMIIPIKYSIRFPALYIHIVGYIPMISHHILIISSNIT